MASIKKAIDVHVTTGVDYSGCNDPLLKLYFGRPMIITKSVDVINSLPNGTAEKNSENKACK